MTLCIKTDEAERLARELARLTGETLTNSITKAERDPPTRLREFAARIQGNFDTRTVKGAEWDWASGDEV